MYLKGKNASILVSLLGISISEISYLLHCQSTYLYPIVVARWRSWDFFPTTSRRGWDSNPHQESCTELGPLKDALPNEQSRCVRKIN